MTGLVGVDMFVFGVSGAAAIYGYFRRQDPVGRNALALGIVFSLATVPRILRATNGSTGLVATTSLIALLAALAVMWGQIRQLKLGSGNPAISPLVRLGTGRIALYLLIIDAAVAIAIGALVGDMWTAFLAAAACYCVALLAVIIIARRVQRAGLV